MDKRHQILLNLIISILLFALIFYLVGFNQIVSTLLQVKLQFVALAVITYLIMNVIMSYRISLVLSNIGAKIKISKIFPSNLAGMLASDFTPARVGYFFTAFSISSQEEIPLEKTMMSIFGPQIFDFLIKISSAAIMVWFVLSKVGISNLLLNVIVLGGSAAAILFAALLVFYPPLLSRLTFFERFPVVPRIFSFLRKMHEHSDAVLSIKWSLIGVTLVTWSLKGLEWLFLAKALNISLGLGIVQEFFFIMLFQAAVTVLQFLPLPTLAGVGASEAGFVAILYVFGIPADLSVAYGFLTRLLMIGVDSFSLPVLMNYLHTHTLEKSLEEVEGSH